MYNNGNVAGTGGRRVNRCKEDVAGDFGRRCNREDVAGDFGLRRCDFVFECLEELLEEVLGDRGRRKCDREDVAGDSGRRRCDREDVAGDSGRRRCDCEFVFECLEELLEEVLGETGNNNNHHCKCHRD